MKSPISWLPSLLLFGFVAALAAQVPATSSPDSKSERENEIRELRLQLQRISDRLEQLEAEGHHVVSRGLSSSNADAPAGSPAGASVPASSAEQPKGSPTLSIEDRATLDFFRGTTINFGIDGYYGYNFNEPIGRVNLLRAYDVTSNSFNLNQASVVVEHLPSQDARFGGRIDLQYGQATETLQGSSANEQRPQVWRNLFQAYGSYLAPVGSGLQLDFGKFASALGNEGNYSKDQVNYSRAYSFDYLPFYHMGVRATYTVTPKLGLTYWLVNGANDTEDLNGFKSQAVLLNLKPTPSVSWSVNYYFGQEARDVQPSTGLPATNISPAPNGREHIFDTYATWRPTARLALTPEADYVLNRTVREQPPLRVVIGSLTAKYALPRDWNLGLRGEYLDDRGGLFSGTTQALKEFTVSLDHLFAPGFLARAEYRRDWSNQRYFLSDTAGVLMPAQTTATLGLMYWWGTKQGSW